MLAMASVQSINVRLTHRYRRNAARSKPAPTIDRVRSEYIRISPVGASLLAIASVLPIHTLTDPPLSPASRLLQGACVRFCFSPLIRPSVSSPSAFDLSAPSRGRAQVLRSGQPGMDAGLAAHGQGWPIAAGPRSRTGARAWRALARHRTKGARALGYLGLFQVTRRKGETNSRHHHRNGYVLNQPPPTSPPQPPPTPTPNPPTTDATIAAHGAFP